MKAPFYKVMTFAMLAITFFSCEKRTPINLKKQPIIPRPLSVKATHSSFVLSDKTVVYYNEPEASIKPVATYLTGLLNPSTGYNIKIQSIDKTPPSNGIYLALIASEDNLGDEGYKITIEEDLITINAHQAAGIFYGVQTLRQLLPPKIESNSPQEEPWEIATGTINDKPSYGYRGAMLDVARHFFQVEEVKRYIDHMAAYKLNHLHLHLSDDQGWRIEIKSWPNLTEYGAQTQVGGGKGGFYSQDEYTDIVNYAAGKFITIVPEIDMPGHTNAALASYAELNCNGKATKLYSGIEVGFSTLCTDKDITYKFIDDVIKELAALTPGPYIHIGGDESHATPMEDYIPFINKVQSIVVKHDKKVIGWDEIAHASLVPNATVQYWAKADNAKKGIDQDAKVLVSPAVKTYLDMQYDSTTQYGLHWAAYIEVDEAYTWAPETMVEGMTKDHILGVESPLWSETVTNISEIEYMAFPRIVCHAEVGWTDTTLRNWEEFKYRLGDHGKRFQAMGINYYKSERVPWQ